MSTIRFRKAIAMIELIFAIVIMGIVMMSAPRLLSQASKSSMMVAQQEAIASVSTNIGMILTRHWDEQDTNSSTRPPILITKGNSALNQVEINGKPTGNMKGMPALSSRSFLTSLGEELNATKVADFKTEADFDDVDDYDGDSAELGNPLSTDSTSTQAGDYIDDSLVITTTVSYISDNPTSGSYASSSLNLNAPFSSASSGTTSNIKSVMNNVKSGDHDDELGVDVTLRAFTCNIGTYKLEKRSF